MGEVIPGKCITNALQQNNLTLTLFSDWDWAQMWEEWRPTANHAVVVSQATVELMQKDKGEEDEEADMGDGSSTGNLAPR